MQKDASARVATRHTEAFGDDGVTRRKPAVATGAADASWRQSRAEVRSQEGIGAI